MASSVFLSYSLPSNANVSVASVTTTGAITATGDVTGANVTTTGTVTGGAYKVGTTAGVDHTNATTVTTTKGIVTAAS